MYLLYLCVCVESMHLYVCAHMSVYTGVAYLCRIVPVMLRCLWHVAFRLQAQLYATTNSVVRHICLKYVEYLLVECSLF